MVIRQCLGKYGIASCYRKFGFGGKKILITGHNGFKGTWLCTLLDMLNAEIFGISLPQRLTTMLMLLGYKILFLKLFGCSRFAKINFISFIHFTDIIIHMAAQSLVSAGYSDR